MISESDLNISWPAIARFVRQLTHDVRNQLNGLELETALIADCLPPDPEALESLGRIREQLHHVAGSLKTLSSKFADPCPTASPIAAAELFLIFQEQAAGMDNLPPIEWAHTLDREQINVDATELANAAKELLTNAREFGAKDGHLRIEGRAETGKIIYEFHEPKSAPLETARWGRVPFHSTRRNGGYGLGLWETRRIVEANSGKIIHEYKPGEHELLTTLSFPIA
jgi:signal transduction histidine kinase